MSWPRSTQFGHGRDAREAGRKGGSRSPHARTRTPEWLRGYGAGWRACQRWFLAMDGKVKRGKHSNQDERRFRPRKTKAA